MAVMVVWEHEDADFCCVSSHDSRDVNWVTWSSRMVYIARRTQGKAAFLAPLAPCGQQKGAKRPFSPIIVDFDQKTQTPHQNKPGIGIAHRFYIEKGITGVISGEVFFYRPPLTSSSRATLTFFEVTQEFIRSSQWTKPPNEPGKELYQEAL